MSARSERLDDDRNDGDRRNRQHRADAAAEFPTNQQPAHYSDGTDTDARFHYPGHENVRFDFMENREADGYEEREFRGHAQGDEDCHATRTQRPDHRDRLTNCGDHRNDVEKWHTEQSEQGAGHGAHDSARDCRALEPMSELHDDVASGRAYACS